MTDELEIINTATMNNLDFWNFLKNVNLIKSSATCETCLSILTKLYFINENSPYFCCNRKACPRTKKSVLKGTIFEETKLNPQIVFLLLYLCDCCRVQSDTEETLGLKLRTMQSFYALFHFSLFFFLEHFSVQFGDDSVVVHVDETPITRHHSNAGRIARSNAVWVIGAVDVAIGKQL